MANESPVVLEDYGYLRCDVEYFVARYQRHGGPSRQYTIPRTLIHVCKVHDVTCHKAVTSLLSCERTSNLIPPLTALLFLHPYLYYPIPVAARSKAWVCGRSLAGIAGSNSVLAWIFVCCECCAMSDRGLCVGLITRPEEPYRVWCVWV
jgi:hypothetical protein